MNRAAAAGVPEWLRRGIGLHQQGRLPEAQALYRQILRREPANFDALHLSGLIAHQNGESATALQLIRKALAINPRDPSAHCNLGSVLQALGQLPEALASLDRAIAIRPDFSDACFNRGVALQAMEHWAEALRSYDRTLALRPDYADAHCNRGVVLYKLRRWDESLASYERAIGLEPGMASAWCNHAALLRDLGETQRALRSCEHWIAIAATDAAAHIARGNVLQELRDWPGALSSYDRAIALDPECGEAHFCKSVALLLCGELVPGWVEHEWRWKNLNGPNIRDPRHFPQPLWTGQEPLACQTILLYGEQGFGDTLQFCRYASLVAEGGARVLLEVREPLRRLVRSLAGPAGILRRGDPLPAFDRHCPLMSLPLAFGTTLGTIPAPRRYLAADASDVTRWRGRLGAKDRPRIGLAWSGNPLYPHDHRRNVPLAQLLAALPASCHYVSLQKEVRDSDLRALREHGSIADFSSELGDFADTAALCECLDLVITVDTSVAHLCGALGVRTWVLLPSHPDWRWLLDREDSPWYPTLRLFRQDAGGGWSGALERVAAAVQALPDG